MYSIKMHRCFWKRRLVHRESTTCCFSVGTVLFPDTIVHFYSYITYILRYRDVLSPTEGRRRKTIGLKSSGRRCTGLSSLHILALGYVKTDGFELPMVPDENMVG
jgi:hypothetical protein